MVHSWPWLILPLALNVPDKIVLILLVNVCCDVAVSVLRTPCVSLTE